MIRERSRSTFIALGKRESKAVGSISSTVAVLSHAQNRLMGHLDASWAQECHQGDDTGIKRSVLQSEKQKIKSAH